MVFLLVAGCSTSQPDNGDLKPEDEYLEEISQAWAEYYQVDDPPEVDVVRFISTYEADQVHRECLTASGFDGDGVGFMVPHGQESVFAEAEYVCQMQYPLKQEYAQDWGNGQVEIQYQWTKDFLIPCLEEHGHPITRSLPSEAKFIETWESEPYYPFEEVTLSVPDEEFNRAWADLEYACPQIAPSEVIWDGVDIATWKELQQ